MSGSSADVTSIRDAVEDAANVLVLAPSMGRAANEGCARLLAAGTPTDRVLCVTLADAPDERLAAWRDHLDEPPRAVGFVDVGDPTRSTSAAGASAIDLPGGGQVETVSSPGDLTGIGIKIGSILSEWAGDDAPIGCCFHSLTTLLQYVDVRAAFRFLHVLTGRFEAVDAVAHYHLDPGAHDEGTVNTLASLFDAVVEHDDGGWTVRRR